MDTISVIVPCFNEQEVLPLLYDELAATFADLNAAGEFIFVDDGSRDKTLEVLKGFAKKDRRVKYISFSRNFGKEAAIWAGLSHADGEYAVLMDADLQHPPKMLAQMYETIKTTGCDSVAAKRVSRKSDSALRKLFSNLFFAMMRRLTKLDLFTGATDYRMMSREMLDAVLSLREFNRFTKGIFAWVGFDTRWLEYPDTERAAGKTTWSFWGLLKYSIDGVVGFSASPLYLPVFVGIASILFSIAAFIVASTSQLPIWVTLAPVSLFAGLILVCVGILGIYLSKIQFETKHRPIYIEKESNL